MNHATSASIAALVVAITSGAATAATVSSDFTLGREGWSVTTFTDNGEPNFLVPQSTGFLPTFVALGGDPGGFMQISDPDDGWTYFISPDTYHGNQSDKLGGTLGFSLQHSGGTLIGNPPHAVLKGGGRVLVADAGEPPALMPNWTRYNISMTAGNWRVGTLTGALATEAELALTLGALDGLFLVAEFVTPVIETNGLDSVSLTAVPLPAGIWGMLGALSLLGMRGTRRPNRN